MTMDLKTLLSNKKRFAVIPCFVTTILILYCGFSLTKNFNMRMCGQESRHIAYIKLHKTGSSTAQNIFLRYGVTRNLVFLLSSVTQNECGGAYHCISFTNTLTDTNIAPPPPNSTYEIMCSHVVYNKKTFGNYLPEDTRYISLIREPVDRLSSAIEHFQLLKDVSLSDFANEPFAFDHFRLNNGMAFELGFPDHLFPRASHRVLNMKEKKMALDYIDELLEDFALIMINERLDESLVLLKRTLHWHTKDILYKNQVVGSKSYRKFGSAKYNPHLTSYLALDYMLYENVLIAFEEKVRMEGNDFQLEVEAFKQINAKVATYCASASSYNPRASLVFKKSRWHAEFRITYQNCKSLRRSEEYFFELIRVKQYGVLDIN